MDQVPRQEQWQARQELLNATPRHIGAAERAVRMRMPNDFWPPPRVLGMAEARASAKAERALEAKWRVLMKRLNYA